MSTLFIDNGIYNYYTCTIRIIYIEKIIKYNIKKFKNDSNQFSIKKKKKHKY